MKNRLIATITAAFAFTACVGQPPRRDFDRSQHIQSIAVTKSQHIFAQGDVLLDQNSLDRQLSETNAQWKADVEHAQRLEKTAGALFLAQLATLAVCLAQRNTANVLGWCGGSIALGVISFPLQMRSNVVRSNVVNEFNKTRP